MNPSGTPLTSRRSTPKNVANIFGDDYRPSYAWRESAYCLELKADTNLFFAMNAENKAMSNALEALAICQKCTVKAECLFEAIKFNYDGVWGATVYRQRLYYVRNYLNNDIDNLTMEKTEEFLQMATVQNVRFLGKKTKETKPKEVQTNELS